MSCKLSLKQLWVRDNTHKKRRLESNKDVQHRVYQTTMRQQCRTELKKMLVADVRAKATDLRVPTTAGGSNITKPELIEKLLDAMYPPPLCRELEF